MLRKPSDTPKSQKKGSRPTPLFLIDETKDEAGGVIGSVNQFREPAAMSPRYSRTKPPL